MLRDIVQAYADTVHVAMTLRAPGLPPGARDAEPPSERPKPDWLRWSAALAGLIGLSSWH